MARGSTPFRPEARAAPDSARPRVLALSDFAPPERGGGVERAIAEIYTRIVASRSADVVVLALADSRLPARTSEAGVAVVRTPRWSLEGLTGLQAALGPFAWRDALRAYRRVRPQL